MKAVVIALLFLCSQAFAMSVKDRTCLYNTVFHEANLEPMKGKRAIADVVLNRAKEQNKSVCSIVKQKAQFSFVGRKKFKKLDNVYLDRVLLHPVAMKDATFFHHVKIKPKWKFKELKYVGTIGKHKFYKQRRNK